MTSAGRRQGSSIRSQTLIERAERRSGRHCSLRNLLEPKTVDPRPVNATRLAVHYNEWAKFGKNYFGPVVAAFKELLGCFSCETCESWYTLRRVELPSISAANAVRSVSI